MALADNRWQRSVMLCAMYFAQGFPWGFMVLAVVNYLVDQGITEEQTGELTAIVMLPWSFKLIWGPIIDSLTYRAMGRRRVWIIGAELMMALSLLGMLFMGDLTQNLVLLGWMFFIHNCFASLQDVATDALAVDILPANEQGRMAGLMWGIKLGGKGAGGATAFVIRDWGLEAAVALQMIVLLVIMVLPVLWLERRGEKRFPWSRGQAAGMASETSVRNPLDVLKDLARGLALPPNFLHAILGFNCILAWGIVEVATKTLYIQQLGWNYVDVSAVQSSAVSVELLGAICGGILADRFGRRKVILLGFGGYGFLHIAFAVASPSWDQRALTEAYLFYNPMFIAAAAVGFSSMAMRISWTRAAATMFTLYMAVTNLGHVIGNWAVAWLREGDRCSYEQIFWIAGLFSLAPLVLLPLIRPEQVDLARAAEAEAGR